MNVKKRAIARAHRELGLWRDYFSAFHPIERLPLADARRETRLRDLSQLKLRDVTTSWAASFVLLDGRRAAVQLRLW